MNPFPSDRPRVTTYTYDAENRLITVQHAPGQDTDMTSEAPAAPTWPLGPRTTFTYNADGCLVAVNDPLEHPITITYDADALAATFGDTAPDDPSARPDELREPTHAVPDTPPPPDGPPVAGEAVAPSSYQSEPETDPAMAPLVTIKLGNQTLRVAADQHFMVEGRGWTVATDLIAGDRLRADDGRVLVVTRVTAS